MEVSHQVLDVPAYISQGHRPAHVIERQGTSLWLVRHQDILTQDASSWGWVNTGDFVRIPLYPYLTHSADEIAALGFAYQLGFQSRDLVGNDVGAIKRLHLVLGSPFEEVQAAGSPPRYRFWLGFAVEVTPSGNSR